MNVENPAGRTEQRERFRPLPRGVNALDPETVAAEQRRRIHRALAELVAERGYRGTRVVDLLKRARVSGPTFYALCGSKEGAFLSAYDETVGRGIQIAAEAEHLPGEDWLGTAQAGLRAFSASILADPPMARMVVVDTPTIGPAGLQRREQAIASLEALIGQIAEQAPGGAGAPALVIRAIVGGWREVIHHALRHERAQELTGLGPGLSEWALSYKVPDDQPYPDDHDWIPPGRVPRGRVPGATTLEDGDGDEDGHATRARAGAGSAAGAGAGAQAGAGSAAGAGASTQAGAGSAAGAGAGAQAGAGQRERIVSAVAAIACAGGYAGLSVPKIARRAGVSHEAFYQHFHDKDDAFTATYELACELTLAGVAHAHNEALAHGGHWPDAVAAGITALTRILGPSGRCASESPLARMGWIEALQAGPRAADTRERYLASFTTLLAPGQQLRPNISPIATHAIVGGIYEIIRQEINHDRTDNLPQLAPALTYIALAPFMGAMEAAGFVTAKMS